MGLGFESLIDGLREANRSFSVVDITWGGLNARSGGFGWRRLAVVATAVLHAWLHLPRVDAVYLTISSSFLGFLRDALIVGPARLFGKRVVCHLKGGGYDQFYCAQNRLIKFAVKQTIGKASIIIVLGELLRSQFSFLEHRKRKPEICVIPNGLTLGLEPDAFQIKSVPEMKKPWRILYLSNMIKAKGYFDVLKACKMLKAQGLPFVCDFCGRFIETAIDESNANATRNEREFHDGIKKFGLQDLVRFRGLITGREKEDLLRRAHVFVLPTAYPWEGQPLSIIEALAFATPIISTCHKGIPEQVIHDYNGKIVDFNNPDQIAQAVVGLALDPDLYSELSRNARTHFEKHFTRAVHLRRLIEVIYGGVLERAEGEDTWSRE